MNFLKLIKILYKAKWVLQQPEVKKILIFNSSGSEIIKKYIAMNSYQILSDRYCEINFYCVIKTIFSKKKFTKKFSHNYFINFIQLSKAKIIISHIDNNPFLWGLKEHLPKIKILLIQNGIRIFEDKKNLTPVKQDNPFGILKRNKKIGNVDFFFVANKYFSNRYKEFINCKTKIIGYFRNNQLTYNSKKIEKNSLTYISQYRPNYKYKHNVDMPDEKILKFLNEYAFKNNKKLNILCGPVKLTTKNFEREKLLQFCKKELKFANWKFYQKNKGISSRYYNYIKCINSNVIVTIDSTLGYELLARGKRVAFFSTRDWGGYHLKFGYPKKMNNSGVFWTNNYDVKKYKKILDYLFLNSDQNFYNKNKKIISDLVFFDKKNSIFKKTIKNLENKK